MAEIDFKEYTYEQLITIAEFLYEDCQRLRLELDKATGQIR